MKVTKEDAAWQAGFIDGEGCLTIAKQIRKGRPSPAYRASVTVCNTNQKLLQPFLKWGGNIYHMREKRNRWADAYTWHCADKSISAFLGCILPYLKGKRMQAKIILEFIENKKGFRRHSLGQGKGSAPLGAEEIKYREKLWLKIKSLNSKGVYARSIQPERR